MERAKADRSWETRQHRLGRLLRFRLENQERWDERGVDRGQLVVGVRSPKGLDDDAMLDAVAAQVLAGRRPE